MPDTSTVTARLARLAAWATTLRRTLITIAAVAAVVAAGLLTQVLMLNWLLLWLRKYLVLVVLLVAGIVFGAFCWFKADQYKRRRFPATRRLSGDPAKRRLWIGLGFATVAVLVGAIVLLVNGFYGYMADRIYSRSVTVVDDPQPGYQERLPFTVGRAQAQAAVTVVGVLGDTTYLPDQQAFTTPVIGKGFNISPTGSGGMFQGYQAIVEQHLSLAGTKTEALTCSLDTSQAARRLGGAWTHSLERAIIRHTGYGVIIRDSDAYGWCDGTTPMIAVPFTRYTGWLPVTEVPGGVAVYNGLTGDLTVTTEVKSGDLPGPVFPQSLAEKLRQSTAATGTGFLDYLFGRAGWTQVKNDYTVLDDGTQVSDPNQGNNADFMLATTDGTSQMVTPLTIRGRATSVMAVGTVDADRLTAGQVNPYTIYRLPELEQRAPGSKVADEIKSAFPEPNWAAGAQVFEIAPLGPGQWAASVGMTQSIAYRVHYFSDGYACLLTPSGQTVRCTGDNQGGGTGYTDPGVTEVGATDLSSLSDAELLELLGQIVEELQTRQ